MLNDSPLLDRMFRALADPSRRCILARLSDGPASVSDLARPLPISLPAVLQHLQALEASGLIISEKAGRVRTCRIQPAAFAEAEAWLSRQRAAWEARTDRLEDHLEAMQNKGETQ